MKYKIQSADRLLKVVLSYAQVFSELCASNHRSGDVEDKYGGYFIK